MGTDRSTRSEFTQHLLALSENEDANREVLGRAFELAYDELRRIAARLARGERRDLTLQPTEIVHEVFERLVDPTQVRPENRAHFFGIAARATD